MPTTYTNRVNSALVVLLAILVIAALLYCGAYVSMGSRAITPAIDMHIFEHEWQEYFFRPAAKLESLIRQKPVDTAHKTD